MNGKSILSKAALALAAAAFLVSCKEKVGGLDFGSVATDTAFVAALETPQYRHVLIEEFTGVSCPPCPKGHAALDGILAQHYNAQDKFDSVSVIGIQSSGIPQAEPVNEGEYKSRHDNRTTDGSELYNTVYGTFGSIPRAGVDRVIPAGGIMALARDLWATSVNTRLRVPTPVNITLTSTYNNDSRQAVIKVHVAYTGDVSKKQKLNLALIENGLIDAQKNDLEIDSMYHHEHVLRDMITAATGDVMLSGVAIKAGQVYERTFVYTVDSAWNPANCRLIAYVINNEGSDIEVQQSAEISLK